MENLAARLRKISILLVFQSPLDLDRLCRSLERDQRITAEISSSVENAIHLMHYLPFDLVILEYPENPPDCPGFIRWLRKRSPCIPVILYGKTPDPQTVQEIRIAGHVYPVIRDDLNDQPAHERLFREVLSLFQLMDDEHGKTKHGNTGGSPA